MARTLFSRIFPNDAHHVAGFHDELTRLAPVGGRLLDLGCGANADLDPYRAADREVWGTDFDRHAELQHPEWFRQLGADGTIPFPDRHFDLVAANMVLEHVAEPPQFFREVARVLRPDGHFVGHTVSGLHYVTWVRRLFGLLPHAVNQTLVRRLYGRAEADTFPAFYRLNSEPRVRRAAGLTGLTLLRARRYADPGYFRFTTATTALALLADRLLTGISSSCGRLYFTVVLRRDRTAA